MAISTVNVKINGLFQNSTPFTGYVTFKLIRVAFTDDTLIFPKEGHRVPFKSNGESTVKLIPNSVTGEDTYYEYTVTKTSKSGLVMKREEVLTAICVVPETDCNLVDISDFSTASPTAQLYAVQAKAYRDEAKSYSGTSKEYAEEAEQHLEDITSAENALDAKITAEKTRATTAENSLSSSISTETTRATTAESSLSSSISAETTRATTAESSLSSSISAETTRATNAEDALSSFISAETSRASAKEEELQGNIESEANNRESAISTHNSSNNAHSDIRKLITDEISDRSSAISTSVSTHNSSSSAHSDIRNAITAEATSRGTAISSAIATEVSNRNTAIGNAVSSHNSANTAHSDIRQLVTAEATARENAVSSEADARNTAITEHDSATDAHADIRQLVTAEATARASADSTLNSGIATLSTQLDATKKALKIEQRNVENLKALLKDTDYKDVEDDRTLHSKTLGDAEVCGSDTTVLPNGLLNSIGGRTVVWNQLVNITQKPDNTHNGVTFSRNQDGSVTINGTATDDAYILIISRSNIIQGHKYFYGSQQNTANYGCAWGLNIFSTYMITEIVNNVTVCVKSGNSVSNVRIFPQVIDLTQMFGAGNEPATVDAFEAYFDTSVYHPYNSGTLMSLPVKSVVTQGKNLFGGEKLAQVIKSKVPSAVLDENSKIITYTAQAVSGKILLENIFKPNTRYTFITNTTSTSSAYFTNLCWRFTDGTASNIQNAVGYMCASISTSGKSVRAIEGSWSSGTNVLKYEETGVFEGVVTVDEFTPYCRTSLVIPQSVKALAGYGVEGNVLDLTAKTFTQNKAIVDGELTDLTTPVVTDISSMVSDDFDLLTNLETGGTVTFVSDGVDPSGTVVLTDSEQSLPVPNTIAYQTKIAS